MSGLLRGKALGLFLQIFGGALFVASPVFFAKDFQKVAGSSGILERSISALSRVSQPLGDIFADTQSFQSTILKIDIKKAGLSFKVPHKQVRLEFSGFAKSSAKEGWVLERITPKAADAESEEVFSLYFEGKASRNKRDPLTLSTGYLDLDPGINEFSLYRLESASMGIRGPASKVQKNKKTFTIEFIQSH